MTSKHCDQYKKKKPFSFSYSPIIPQILYELNTTLIISTYQAGKMVFLCAPDPNKITQLPRNFQKPMGITTKGDKMAVATLGSVVVFKNEPKLAEHYPPNPGVYDAMYVPRVSYYTGMLDIHDISWGNAGLWAVNTQFSCLSLISEDYCFDPQWQPPYITKLLPEDRCHLNGLCLENGEPAYVTALGYEDVAGSWRNTKIDGGVLMHVPTNEIVAEGLAMPHSPRLINGKIYLLQSAKGELVSIDVKTGKKDVLADLGGFVRGMEHYGDYLFIGLSKIRKSSKGFADLPVAKKANKSGVIVFNLKTGQVTGTIIYEESVDEIYDVRLLPNMRHPGIIGPGQEPMRWAMTSPNGSYWKVPKKK